MKKNMKPIPVLAPVPVVMVSCSDGENDNITTVAWTGIINSEPLMVYISLRPERKSYSIINSSKEFVINIPNNNLVYEADYCGTKSGRNENKFETLGLTKEKSSKVNAPAIVECPINLECKVEEIKNLGSHNMIIARVLSVNVEKEYITENNKINFLNANLLTYLGTDYIVANNKVGERGICLKSK